MVELSDALRKHWGYDRFLPLQAEAMACVREARDSLVVLPTGGGKSVCFQVPALVLPGMAVVVSPLIALMKDQVEALVRRGIGAAYLNSSQTPSEQEAVIAQIYTGALKLLYVAPERLLTSPVLALLSEVPVSFLAVDEAHCVSMWGHDFRTDYRQLRTLRQTFPNGAIHAYTATATEPVRNDIVTQLELRAPSILVGSFDRPNLVYSAQRRTDLLGQLCPILDRHTGQPGIIYCIRRADVDELYATLKTRGYRALPYHAGMSDGDRKRSQDAFIHDKADIIVATIAFGMGIDKANVRFVVHAAMPKSIEHYHQETGRAGRDGIEAECCLLFSYSDWKIWESILQRSEEEMEGSPAEKAAIRDVAVNKLREMYNYCCAVQCRHRALTGYFGQDVASASCGACDVCLGTLDAMEDSKSLAQKIVSCVRELRERFGAMQTARVLCGTPDERIESFGHTRLKAWGVLSERTERHVRDWIEQLVSQGFLAREKEHKTLQVTPEGSRLLAGHGMPRLLRPAGRTKQKRTRAVRPSQGAGAADALLDALDAVRRAKAAQLGVEPLSVLTDATLRDLVQRRPLSLEELALVHGVTKKMIRDCGADLVGVIRGHGKSTARAADVVPDGAEVAEHDSAGSDDGVHDDLFEELRLVRRAKAAELGVPAFAVFSDAALRSMAQARPSTPQGFLSVYGVGKTKLRDFGELFLAAIRRYCNSHGLDMDAPPKAIAIPRHPHPKTNRTASGRRTEQLAFDLFLQGCSIEEVAQSVSRSPSWALEKLALFLESEGRTSPEPWLDAETFQRISDAAAQTGLGRLKPIYLLLDEQVPYHSIRLAVACLRVRA